MRDTLLPLQTPNPTEGLAKAQGLPLHIGKQSSAFAAMPKQVFPLQRALGWCWDCSMGAAETPKSHSLIEHILLELSPVLSSLFGVFLGLWVLGGTPEGWVLQGCSTEGLETLLIPTLLPAKRRRSHTELLGGTPALPQPSPAPKSAYPTPRQQSPGWLQGCCPQPRPGLLLIPP